MYTRDYFYFHYLNAIMCSHILSNNLITLLPKMPGFIWPKKLARKCFKSVNHVHPTPPSLMHLCHECCQFHCQVAVERKTSVDDFLTDLIRQQQFLSLSLRSWEAPEIQPVIASRENIKHCHNQRNMRKGNDMLTTFNCISIKALFYAIFMLKTIFSRDWHLLCSCCCSLIKLHYIFQ